MLERLSVLVILIGLLPTPSPAANIYCVAEDQAESVRCAEQAANDSADDLDDAYDSLRKFVDDAWRLSSAQRDWISFRDSFCEFEASQFAGDAADKAEASCQVRLNIEQSQRLNAVRAGWQRL